MKVSTISIDLAKNIFQVRALDSNQNTLFNKRVYRQGLLQLMLKQPPCRVVMEACYSSHYWGRVFQQMGHDVQLIPAQHVTPFVRGNKNDSNDTLAIFEASIRPNIRTVPVKTTAQQEVMALHRIRERLIKAKIAATNQIRGLLIDFGIIIPKGKNQFETGLIDTFNDDNQSPTIRLIADMALQEYRDIKQRLKINEQLIQQHLKQHPNFELLLGIPGIGPIIASAFLASIDKGQAFASAKDFAVWLGVTPKQSASGHKSIMLGISKRGDGYLRKQLIHGARTVVAHSNKKNDDLNLWINQLKMRKSFNCVVVATAHRLARLIWILLQKQTHYQAQYNNLESKEYAST